MNKKIFEHLGGMVTVKLSGKNLEKVINMAMARGIFLWNIKRTDDGLSFRVRQSGFTALQSISQENGFELRATRRQGLPFFKQVLYRRLGFIGGALFFVAALYILSSFVWFVEVSGNRVVDKGRILQKAQHEGVYKGAPKWRFSARAVEDAMLRDINELSYVRINVQGVKARIEVVEKSLPSSEIAGPCHIVASRDGVIEEVLVLNGQAAARAGDVVAKGEIVISGLMDPPSSPYVLESETEKSTKKPTPVRARGIVRARVWYEGYGECSLKTEKLILTGAQGRSLSIITPWGRKDMGSKPVYEVSQNSKAIKTFTSPVGEWGIEITSVQELALSVVEYSEAEAVALARDRALKSLSEHLPGTESFIDSKVEVLSSPSDPILRVKVAVEVMEDIAEAQPFALPQMAKK